MSDGRHELPVQLITPAAGWLAGRPLGQWRPRLMTPASSSLGREPVENNAFCPLGRAARARAQARAGRPGEAAR